MINKRTIRRWKIIDIQEDGVYNKIVLFLMAYRIQYTAGGSLFFSVWTLSEKLMLLFPVRVSNVFFSNGQNNGVKVSCSNKVRV